MAPPPELIDNVTASLPPDLISEILLRLPPDEPEHLFRAALVCKSWLRAICEHGFLRRYRAFSAFFTGSKSCRETPPPASPAPQRCPSPPIPPFAGPSIAAMAAPSSTLRTMIGISLSGIPSRANGTACQSLASPVFCAASGCDHLDCHGGPFRVVFIATDDDDELVKASVYSSETCAWNKTVILADGYQTWQERLQAITRGESYRTPYVQPRRGALVGDEIYFTLRNENAIIKYNWAANCLSKIDPPIRDVYDISLMEMENGSLGYACIQGSSLYVWSRNASSEGAAEWVQCWVIELEQMVPVANRGDEAFVVGSAEGVGVIFMSTGVGLFTIELKSRRVKKVEEPGVYSSVLPYMSFYTPVEPQRSASHAKLNSWIMFTSITTLQGRGSEENVLDKDGKYGL
uniref:F-box domain-containing protein n=1 Tax=Oryza rufipogon TaxID=4529 RepID=A0A0E0QH32_ORYRU